MTELLGASGISWKYYEGGADPEAFGLWNLLPGFKTFMDSKELRSHLVDNAILLALLTLLCFNSLAHRIMAGNEVDRLTVAKQYVDPEWIPGDWYLNQPVGYQALFVNILFEFTLISVIPFVMGLSQLPGIFQ